MHKIIIIPGFGETTQDKPYTLLSKKLRGTYYVEAHNPVWEYKTATDWIKSLELATAENPSHITIIAFSLGAYITLILSRRVSFKKIILCSTSPFFKEQLPLLPPIAKKILGKRRMADFQKYSIPKKILSKAIFMFGEKDWDMAIKQSKDIAKKLKSKFIVIPEAGHELTQDYIDAIVKLIQ